jgi:hypothetical protein
VPLLPGANAPNRCDLDPDRVPDMFPMLLCWSRARMLADVRCEHTPPGVSLHSTSRRTNVRRRMGRVVPKPTDALGGDNAHLRNAAKLQMAKEAAARAEEAVAAAKPIKPTFAGAGVVVDPPPQRPNCRKGCHWVKDPPSSVAKPSISRPVRIRACPHLPEPADLTRRRSTLNGPRAVQFGQVCSVADCDRVVLAKRLCGRHYSRLRSAQ